MRTAGLLDDVFVKDVFQPQNNPNANTGVAHTANYLGSVDTTSEGVKIVAYSDPLNPTTSKPTGSIFDRWVSPVSGLNLTPGAADLNLNNGQGGYFLAYYRHSCPDDFILFRARLSSACEPDNCKANQFWDAAKNQCETSSCPAGETCGHYTCPSNCRAAASSIRLEFPPNKTNKPIFACKNATWPASERLYRNERLESGSGGSRDLETAPPSRPAIGFHHGAAVTALTPTPSCRSCWPNAPFAERGRVR